MTKKVKPEIRDFKIAPTEKIAGAMAAKVDTQIENLEDQVQGGIKNTPLPETETEFNVDALEDELFDQHMEFLENNGVTEEDLFTALDTIIADGTLKFSFNLFDKIPVGFKMRSQWVNEYVAKVIEEKNPQTYARFSDIVSSWNLAGSIERIGDKKFTVKTIEDLEKSKEHIANMPFVIKARLSEKLALFDRIVSVATSEWCVENFSKPR